MRINYIAKNIRNCQLKVSFSALRNTPLDLIKVSFVSSSLFLLKMLSFDASHSDSVGTE